MYILFIQDKDAETGEFVEFSERYSKITECHIPEQKVIGRIEKSYYNNAKSKQEIVFKDLRKRTKKTFPIEQMAEAVAFGKDYFKTYK